MVFPTDDYLVADFTSVLTTPLLFLHHNIVEKELKLGIEVTVLPFYCCSLIIVVFFSTQGLLTGICMSHLSIL